MIQTKPVDQIVHSQQVDQAAFTPLRRTSTNTRPLLSNLEPRIASNYPLKLIVSNRRGTVSADEKKERFSPRISGAYTATIRKSKLLTATSATTSRLPSSAKTRLTIALRLHPTNRETPSLQSLPNAEKTIKSPSSTRQSSTQGTWVSCTAATSTQRFEGSLTKPAHLLATFRVILIHLPIQCRWWYGNYLHRWFVYIGEGLCRYSRKLWMNWKEKNGLPVFNR